MISILLSTKNRPESFKRMCQSCYETADNQQDLEFVFYRDSDDASIYQYACPCLGAYREVRGSEAQYPNGMFNECFKSARGEIYCFIADDFVFETPSWDSRVREAFDKYPDRIVLVSPNNSEWKTWGFGTVGFLHKNWTDAVGYFAPTLDGTQGFDRWLYDIASSLGRLEKLEDVFIEHHSVRDKVHWEKNAKGRAERWTRKYRSEPVTAARNADIEKLRMVIK